MIVLFAKWKYSLSLQIRENGNGSFAFDSTPPDGSETILALLSLMPTH